VEIPKFFIFAELIDELSFANMRFLEILTVASLSSALSIRPVERDSGLDVKLEMTGNTAVEATVRNLGSTALKVFKTGTILDNTAVEKVRVFQGGKAHDRAMFPYSNQ
jgi:Fe-S cluster assembly ATPase SufC